ncbi:MAG: MgtC/SapB family protein [Caenibius sp.]
MDSLPFRLALALAIGLLIGLERGWRTRSIEDHQRAAGFRTFALIGFLGGLAGALTPLSGEIVLAAALLGFIGVFGAFEWLEARSIRNLSATTMIARIATFLLGAYAVLGEQPIAVGGALAVTQTRLRCASRCRWIAALKWEELRAACTGAAGHDFSCCTRSCPTATSTPGTRSIPRSGCWQS